MKPLMILIGLLLSIPSNLAALGPTVVPTAEGQIGTSLDPLDRVHGGTIESLGGSSQNILFGRMTTVPLPAGLSFFTDEIHDVPNPMAIGNQPGSFATLPILAPTSSQNQAGNLSAFSFISDGTMPNTMNISVTVFDETGSTLVNVPLDNIPTFPDPAANNVGIAADNQGTVTVAYTEVPSGMAARVRAARFDGPTGLPIGSPFTVSADGRADTDIALLDPAGNRLIVPLSDFATIRGNIVDTTGATPVILPEFPISTTAAIFANLNPAVASDPATGNFMVVWENISAVQGDPINVRGRRFDANGNPIGDDFRVNTTTANAQAQPAVAYGQGGVSAVVWASEPGVQGNTLDVFAQAYDADGNPIGGEIRVNTVTDDIQDRPAVRFLPESDAQGRPQFVVAWRDVQNDDGSSPRGTGQSYKCFSIDGITPPNPEIFVDGFESGDTSSWSDSQP